MTGDDRRSTQTLQNPVLPGPLDPRGVPPESKKEEDDTLIVYNPDLSTTLNVGLMNTLYFDR